MKIMSKIHSKICSVLLLMGCLSFSISCQGSSIQPKSRSHVTLNSKKLQRIARLLNSKDAIIHKEQLDKIQHYSSLNETEKESLLNWIRWEAPSTIFHPQIYKALLKKIHPDKGEGCEEIATLMVTMYNEISRLKDLPLMNSDANCLKAIRLSWVLNETYPSTWVDKNFAHYLKNNTTSAHPQYDVIAKKRQTLDKVISTLDKKAYTEKHKKKLKKNLLKYFVMFPKIKNEFLISEKEEFSADYKNILDKLFEKLNSKEAELARLEKSHEALKESNHLEYKHNFLYSATKQNIVDDIEFLKEQALSLTKINKKEHVLLRNAMFKFINAKDELKKTTKKKSTKKILAHSERRFEILCAQLKYKDYTSIHVLPTTLYLYLKSHYPLNNDDVTRPEDLFKLSLKKQKELSQLLDEIQNELLSNGSLTQEEKVLIESTIKSSQSVVETFVERYKNNSLELTHVRKYFLQEQAGWNEQISQYTEAIQDIKDENSNFKQIFTGESIQTEILKMLLQKVIPNSAYNQNLLVHSVNTHRHINHLQKVKNENSPILEYVKENYEKKAIQLCIQQQLNI